MPKYVIVITLNGRVFYDNGTIMCGNLLLHHIWEEKREKSKQHSTLLQAHDRLTQLRRHKAAGHEYARVYECG